MIDKKNLELWKQQGKPKIYITALAVDVFNGYFVLNGELAQLFSEETARPFCASNPWGVVKAVTGDVDCTWEVI